MDSVYLTGPLGTQWNLGSWIDKTQGLDYGARGLVRQQLTQTAFVEGARLSYESAAGARTMTFPVRVPSGGIAGLSVDTIEAGLRQMVRPGGWVDLQPQGVPTGEMVRFDILGGDVAHHAYSVDLQRESRRELTVTLQTQPFGYWPTAIVLASVASIGVGPFKLTIPPGSVIGDVPGFGILQVSPFHASDGMGAANPTWVPDMVAWSVGGRPSFNPFLHPASWLSGGATLGGDANAPASQYIGYYLNATQPWQAPGNLPAPAFYVIPTALAPAYVGRYRFFAFMQLGPSTPAPWRAIGDNLPQAVVGGALATGNPIATVVPGKVPTTLAQTWNSIGSGYQIVDLGEIKIPRFSSAVPGREALRIQMSNASAWMGSTMPSSAFVKIGGAYLLPVDSPAGVLPYGLAQPTVGFLQAPGGVQFLNAQTRDNLIFRDSNVTGATPIGTGQDTAQNGNVSYRGQLPIVGATVNQLTGFVGIRGLAASYTDPPVLSPNTRAGISLSYVPRFQFLKGL